MGAQALTVLQTLLAAVVEVHLLLVKLVRLELVVLVEMELRQQFQARLLPMLAVVVALITLGQQIAVGQVVLAVVAMVVDSGQATMLLNQGLPIQVVAVGV